MEIFSLENLIFIAAIIFTLVAYNLAKAINKRLPSPLTSPIFLATAMIIACLLALGMTYEDYRPSGDMISFFLGPATVALALPLYRNFHVLVKDWFPAILGIVLGTLATISVSVALGFAFGYNDDLILALAIKGVTTPIALEIGTMWQGDLALVAGFVVATGTTGTMIGAWVLDRLGIHQPLARGIAYGTVAHGLGTSVAIGEGQTQGAMAGVAMALAAIFTSLIAPLLFAFIL